MVEERLSALADSYGISTQFWDWKGTQRFVSDHTIVEILAAMGVDASTPEAVEDALASKTDEPWRSMLPPVVIQTQGKASSVQVHVADGMPAYLDVELESGSRHGLGQINDDEPARWIDGKLTGQASFELPSSLPTGYHTLHARSENREATSTLIVTPAFLGMPDALSHRRIWGYGAQLYSLRSTGSWGIGDLGDLADLATWAGARQHADYVLINPIHAAQPATPIDDSPYLPSSRLFVNPMYIRPERIDEYACAPQKVKNAIAKLQSRSCTTQTDGDKEVCAIAQIRPEELIDRDTSWNAKIRALEILYTQPRRPSRQIAFEAFKARLGIALERFATWCVLCELHGNDWRTWPEPLQDCTSREVARVRQERAERVDFFAWLQWITSTQLSDAQQAAVDAGMASGLVNDLAVGVGRSSADTWMMPDIYAHTVSVGAPPDAYNQLGQNWGQPPWRPDRLAQTAYAPFRRMIYTALRHSGGVRIDHILGMFRLWWIPEGQSAAEGTYVRYDHEAMIGIIMLEAQRAGAFVVGEDLGTLEGWVRGYLADRGILGTSVLWFENGSDSRPIDPSHWRRYAMASVTTHDLAPTEGYLQGEHIRVRDQLNLLTEPVQSQVDNLAWQLDRWREILAERLLIDPELDEVEAQVVGLHRYLGLTPCHVLNVALTDAVGDRRIQNQPGTWKEYPNWRVPLADAEGTMVSLEDLFVSARAQRLADALNEAVASSHEG